MSAAESREIPQGVAAQMQAIVEAYRAELAVLMRVPQDLETCQRMSGLVDRLRALAPVLPQAAGPVAGLLMRHFELTHALWRAQRDGALADGLEKPHRELQEALAGLAARCAQLAGTATMPNEIVRFAPPAVR